MTPDTPARPSKVRKYFAVPDFDAEGIEWGFLLTEDPGQGPLNVQGNSFWVVPKWDYDALAQKLAESDRKGQEVCVAYGTSLIEIHDLKKKLAESERKLAIAREGLFDLANHMPRCECMEGREIARQALAQISAEGQDEKGGDKA